MSEIGLLSRELSDAKEAANCRLDCRLLEAANNKDVETSVRCFFDNSDMVVSLHGDISRGTDSVRRFLTDRFSTARAIHVSFDRVSHWSLGDTIFAAGTATFEVEAPDGNASVLKE